MRFYLLLTFFFCQTALAQNWAPFPYNQKTWFEFSNEDHYSISLYYPDSLNVEMDSTHYYFHLKYLKDKLTDVYFDGTIVSCLDSVSSTNGLWLDYFEEQAEDFVSIKHPFTEVQGAYYFKGNLVFNPLLQVGESISINSEIFNEFDYVNIECTEQKKDTFLGKMDSVKVFKLTAIKDGQPFASAFNEFEYILSKNYGFIKFLPFPELLNMPKTTANLTGFEDSSGNLCGQSSIQNFLPYEVGDVLYWIESSKQVSEEYTTYHVDSITSVTITDDQFAYTCDRTSSGGMSFTGILGDIKTFNLNDYQVFNHAIYGVEQQNKCIDNINLKNNSFSFEPLENSYDLTYNCTLPFATFATTYSGDIITCSVYEYPFYYFYGSESFTFNSSLGLILWQTIDYRFRNRLELIYYKKDGKEFKPGSQLQESYGIYDLPADNGECGKFYPYLTPDSLLNVPFEVDCNVGIWNFPQTVTVIDEGEGDCSLTNLEIIVENSCGESNEFRLSFDFDFRYEGGSDFVALLNGTPIDTFTYENLYLRSEGLNISNNSCFEVNEPEDWELKFVDIEFPDCSVSQKFTVPDGTLLGILPSTGAFECDE